VNSSDGERCTNRAIDHATNNGCLDVLHWLLSKELSWTSRAMDKATENGHLDVVKYRHSNRTEGCTTNAMDQAAHNGHLDVVKWLHFNRTEGCTTKAMDTAARTGRLEVVKFLHSHRTDGSTTDAMDYAHYLEILRWLGENRREGFTPSALSNAATLGDMGMLAWLRDHTTAEMWTTKLTSIAVEFGQVEALEWLADAFPVLVDARVLLSSSSSKYFKSNNWWVWNWLSNESGRSTGFEGNSLRKVRF